MTPQLNQCWFAGGALLVAAALAGGFWLGRRSTGAARAGVGFAVFWMIGWAWLVQHPAVTLQMVPANVLSRVEGFGGVPAFMLMLGVVWSHAARVRQKVVVGWAAVFGVIYFVNGGLWLVQDTPTAVMGHTARHRMVLQSQNYSCVPAACATALNLLGVPSTEAQLAELTDVRPGTGATVVRAVAGLEARLGPRSHWSPSLMEVSADALDRVTPPALTALQFEAGRRHMVVLLAVGPRGVLLLDPETGVQRYGRRRFAGLYRGQLIAFARRR